MDTKAMITLIEEILSFLRDIQAIDLSGPNEEIDLNLLDELGRMQDKAYFLEERLDHEIFQNEIEVGEQVEQYADEVTDTQWEDDSKWENDYGYGE